MLWLREILVESRQVELLRYSGFRRLLKNGQIEEITISDRLIRGALASR